MTIRDNRENWIVIIFLAIVALGKTIYHLIYKSRRN